MASSGVQPGAQSEPPAEEVERRDIQMHRIGIDIGGTFTDIAGFVDGTMHYAKAPSSPDIVQGVVDGVRMMLDEVGVDPESDGIENVHIHGTTIATNVLLERKGARIGLLTTRGHRDALELGRMKRSRLYDFRAQPESPGFLAPGRFRVGITERIDGQGAVATPLDEKQVIEEVRRLVDVFGIEALAVCYLNAYVNPVHEERTSEILGEVFPDLLVSVSSRVNPVFREYERVCCTAFDAYVRPRVVHYVRQLEKSLAREGRGARLHLMQSGGGIASAEMAIAKPVSMFLSGPAAGVIATRYVGRMTGRDDVIGFDVGGTSTDVCLIRDGKAQITREGRIGKYPLRVPMVDMETVGSGGGSIAWIDDGGGLHMGPESAGSVPGPACYGRGGDRPTSSDASIVLGYLNPDYFAGGTLRLQPELSHEVIAGLASRLDLRPMDAALGMYRILVSQMAEAIKLVTVKRGVDPREFTMVSFGGGGGIYAAAVARELGIREVLVPRSPGTLSAFGLLVSDFETDGVKTLFVRNAALADVETVEAEFRRLESRGEEELMREGVDGIPVRHRRTAEMRYEGQAYELEVAIGTPFDLAARQRAVDGFHEVHGQVYGHFNTARQVEVVNLRVVSYQAAADLPDDALSGDLHRNNEDAQSTAARRAAFPMAGVVDAPILRRPDIPAGAVVEGPAIIEQADTTVVVDKGQLAIGEAGNLLIRCLD